MTAASLIIFNARIITMDKARPFAEAMAISGNRISKLGSNTDVLALRGPNTRLVDNRGNSVIPGIIEGHVHLFIAAVELDALNVNAANGMAAFKDAVGRHLQQDPGLEVVFATGATHEQFGAGVPITRQLLDEVVADRPFILGCFDHHTMWANTKALVAAGILNGRSLPVGNEIVLDSKGIATGELKEFLAFMPVLELTPTHGRESAGIIMGEDPSPAPTAAQRKADEDYMRRGIAYANSFGITSMHNMDGNWYQLELLHALEKRGELNARVEIPFHFKNYFDVTRVDEAVAFREKYRSDMLHSGRVKIFMDGVLETLTALMLEDYPGFPGNTGAPLYTADQFNAVATRADAHGLQISVHAIGDGGVRRTLDGFEFARQKNGLRDSRHRIEHIELIDPADVPRLAQLGVIASLQPIAGVGVPGNPHEPILSRVGDKLPYAYAWQMLRETGAAIAFSSDWPISPLDPFLGMQAAMTAVPLKPGCTNQAQSLMDSLHAFTAAGAQMEFMEDRKGTLKEGYLADVAVLNADMEKLKPHEVSAVKPVMTICDGRIVYENG